MRTPLARHLDYDIFMTVRMLLKRQRAVTVVLVVTAFSPHSEAAARIRGRAASGGDPLRRLHQKPREKFLAPEF